MLRTTTTGGTMTEEAAQRALKEADKQYKDQAKFLQTLLTQMHSDVTVAQKISTSLRGKKLNKLAVKMKECASALARIAYSDLSG